MTAAAPTARRQDAAFRIGSYVVNICLGLAHVGLTSRLLGPSEVGIYALGLLVVQPLMDFFNTGLYWTALRCSPVEYAALGGRVRAASLAVAVLAAALAFLYVKPLVLLFLAPCVYLAAIEGYQTGHQFKELRFTFQAVRSTLILLVNLVCSYALALAGLGAASLSAGLALSILAGILVSRFWHRESAAMDAAAPLEPKLVREFALTGFSRSIGNLSANTAGWALGLFSTSALLGAFNRALRMSDVQLSIYNAAIGGMVAPVMAKRGAWSAAEYWASVRRASYFAAALAIPGCLLAPLAIPLLLGPGWEAAVRVTQVLLCGSVFRNINRITDDYLRHHGSIRFAACFTPAFALVSFLCFSGMLFAGVSLTAIAFAHVAFLAAAWLVKLAWLSSPWSSGDGAGVGRGSEWIRVSWLATLAAQMFLLAYYAAA